MRRAFVFGLLLSAALLGACAAQQPRAKPHHYSTARDGTPLACYPGPAENEFECVPERAYYVRDPLLYDPFYDPWWPRWGYGAVYSYYPAYPYPSSPPRPPRPILKDKFPKKP